MTDDPMMGGEAFESATVGEGRAARDMARGAPAAPAGVVEADTVSINQGGAGQVRAREVTVNQGGIGLARANRIELASGSGAFAVLADQAHVEAGASVFLLLAGDTSGEARPLIDLRSAVALGAAFAAASWLLRRLR